MDKWDRREKGTRVEMGLLQVDIVGHSNFRDNDTTLKTAKDIFRNIVNGIVTIRNGKIFNWAGDGGSFMFLINTNKDFEEMVLASQHILFNIPFINKELSYIEISKPISVRISCDSGTVSYDNDPSAIQSEFINSFLKHEREIGLPNTVSITERVHKQLTKELKKQFKDYKYSKEVKSQLFTFNYDDIQEDVEIEFQDMTDGKLPEVFLNKAINSSLQIREILWYQTNRIPLSLKIEILNKYLDSRISEPSWVVRRAIGTFIYSIKIDTEKHKIIKRYLTSPDWMVNCIGLIGGRDSLKNEEIRKLYIDHLQNRNNPVDSVWLANLYLSDTDFNDIDIVLTSKLIHTSWGVLDIWKRYYSKFSDDLNSFLEKINTHIKDKKLLSLLYNYIWLENTHYDRLKDLIDNDMLLEEFKESQLVKEVFHSKKRGYVKDVNIKWLYSFLYGQWRDQLILNIKDFIECSLKSNTMNEFKIADNFPSVEFRMSIFQYLSQNTKYFEEYPDLIKWIEWGLCDPHPWVRRVSLNLFKNNQEMIIETAFKDKIDANLYPGLFDLILEARFIGIDVTSYIERYEFNLREKESLNFYLNVF